MFGMIKKFLFVFTTEVFTYIFTNTFTYILYVRVFGNFIFADKLFAKALRSLKTCVLVNNNICGKLVSSLELPITFEEKFKVTSAPFFYSRFYFIVL